MPHKDPEARRAYQKARMQYVRAGDKLASMGKPLPGQGKPGGAGGKRGKQKSDPIPTLRQSTAQLKLLKGRHRIEELEQAAQEAKEAAAQEATLVDALGPEEFEGRVREIVAPPSVEVVRPTSLRLRRDVIEMSDDGIAAMNRQQAYIGMAMQELSLRLIELAAFEPGNSYALEALQEARQLALTGVKIERVARGEPSGKNTGREERNLVLAQLVMQDPEAVHGIHEAIRRAQRVAEQPERSSEAPGPSRSAEPAEGPLDAQEQPALPVPPESA